MRLIIVQIKDSRRDQFTTPRTILFKVKSTSSSQAKTWYRLSPWQYDTQTTNKHLESFTQWILSFVSCKNDDNNKYCISRTRSVRLQAQNTFKTCLIGPDRWDGPCLQAKNTFKTCLVGPGRWDGPCLQAKDTSKTCLVGPDRWDGPCLQAKDTFKTCSVGPDRWDGPCLQAKNTSKTCSVGPDRWDGPCLQAKNTFKTCSVGPDRWAFLMLWALTMRTTLKKIAFYFFL
jgi:hypothetical protein